MRQQVAPFRFDELGIGERAWVYGLGLTLERVSERVIPGRTPDEDRPVNAQLMTEFRPFILVDPDTYVARH